MQQHTVANILPADPNPSPSPRPYGSKGRNPTFSEHGHVAYQVKGNHKCSNTVTIFCPQTPPP